MLLTIGMIVKNEEKYLERCLNGIKPILDSIDSELIITDTGSTDRTVEIAKRFTDKILHFEWADDFAAARNTALDIAKGEWFMFLDADEIFESCEGIIDFFNSGRHKHYNSASFIIRNLINDSGTYYDMIADRIVHRFSDAIFEGTIHEHLNHVEGPIFDISDKAIHYGYLFENKSYAKQKAQRNLNLLLEELKTTPIPTDPLIYLQIHDSYITENDNEKATEYLEKGIQLCLKNKSYLLAIFYCSKAVHEIRVDNYMGVLDVCNDYFNSDPDIIPHPIATDMEMSAIKASVLYDHLNFSDAKEMFMLFFSLFSDYKEGKLNTRDLDSLVIRMATDWNYVKHLYSFIDCCIVIRDYNAAYDYMINLPIYMYSENKDDVCVLVEKEYIVLEHFCFKNASMCYYQLDEFGKELFINKLISSLRYSDKKEHILDTLNEISEDFPWLNRKVEIYRRLYLSHDLSEKNIIDYVKDFGIMQDVDLIQIALKNQFDISIIFNLPDFDVKKVAYICCKKIAGFYESAGNYHVDNISDLGLFPSVSKFYDYCISLRLMENEEMSEDEKKQLIEDLLAVKAELRVRYERINRKTEFEQLAAAVKNNIRAYISNGNIDVARKTLEDYRNINPNDPNLAELMKMIEKYEKIY